MFRRLIALSLLSLSVAPLRAQTLFSRIDGLPDAHIRKVALSPNRNIMAVASDRSLYTSYDAGKTFNKLLGFTDEHPTHLMLDPLQPEILYLSATRHAYRLAPTAERIFSVTEDEEINYILKHRNQLYIATTEGLHHSRADLLNWQTHPGLRNQNINAIEGFGDNIYLAAESGVYLLRPDASLERLFVTRTNGEYEGLRPLQIRVDPLTPTRLWLGTTHGLFYSPDQGQTWKKFYTTGAANVAVYCIDYPELDANTLYLCSKTGLYKVDIETGIAQPLFAGLSSSRIRWIELTPPNTIHLATDNGLFTNQPTSKSRPTPGTLSALMKNEPSIHQIQTAALRYNSVHPEKMASWRKRIKYRALLPKLSVDYDKTIGYSVSSSGEFFGVGPNDWGVTLSWDFSNMIWDPNEKSEDERNRLMVQLRIDILDEINRLYFERLRLKHEIALNDPATEEIILKELRLHELTAALDGYTGGLLSEHAIGK